MGVTKRKGSPFLQISFQHEGRQIRESIKTTSRAFAERVLAQRKHEVLVGKYFPKEAAGLHRLTIAALLDARITERRSHVSPGTIEFYELSKARLCSIIGDRDARTITRDDIRAYRTTKMAGGLSAASVNRDVTLLGAAFRQACADELVERNPCQYLERLPEPEPQECDRSFSSESLFKIMEVAQPWMRRFIWISYLTGNRVNELAKVRVEDVDCSARTVTFRSRHVKGRRGKRASRTITIMEGAVEAIQIQLQEARAFRTSWLFPLRRDPREPLTSNCVSQAWQTARRKAKVSGRIHDLRHVFVSEMVKTGIATHLISRYIGHRTTSMIEARYDHTRPVNLGILDQALDQVQRNINTNAERNFADLLRKDYI